MGRLYKINPPCPKCHEEHNWWHIQLTDEEQAKMDASCVSKADMVLLLHTVNEYFRDDGM